MSDPLMVCLELAPETAALLERLVVALERQPNPIAGLAAPISPNSEDVDAILKELSEPRWLVGRQDSEFAKRLNIPPHLVHLLRNEGLKSIAEIREFGGLGGSNFLRLPNVGRITFDRLGVMIGGW